MVAFGRRLDISALAVQGVAGALAGGINEQAYRQNETVGRAVTAVTLLGGIGMKLMSNRQPLMDQVGDALFLSGASVAGWKLSEIVLPRTGGVPAFQRARARAAQIPHQAVYPAAPAVVRPPMPTRAAAVPAAVRGNGHYPQVSQLGMNPNTGEQMLHSRV